MVNYFISAGVGNLWPAGQIRPADTFVSGPRPLFEIAYFPTRDFYVRYLFEYNAQNFVLIFNQKWRVRVIDENS